jgi:hypothetical protein
MLFAKQTSKTAKRLYLISLVGLFFLSYQFVILQHSTEHFLHDHADYYLSYDETDDSSYAIASTFSFQLLNNKFELISDPVYYPILSYLRNYFTPRAPPSLFF